MTLPILLDGKKVDKKYLKELIDILGLERRVNHLPNELSGDNNKEYLLVGHLFLNRI